MIEKVPIELKFDKIRITKQHPHNDIVVEFLDGSSLNPHFILKDREWIFPCVRYVNREIVSDLEILILTGKTKEQVCNEAYSVYGYEAQRHNVRVEIHRLLVQSLHKYFDLSEEEMDNFFREMKKNTDNIQGISSLIYNICIDLDILIPEILDEICKKSYIIASKYKHIWNEPLPNFLIAKEEECLEIRIVCRQILSIIGQICGYNLDKYHVELLTG